MSVRMCVVEVVEVGLAVAGAGGVTPRGMAPQQLGCPAPAPALHAARMRGPQRSTPALQASSHLP